MKNEFFQLPDLEDLDFEAPSYKKRALIIKLGGGLYGFPLGNLITVFSVETITPLPNAPQHILGLANYRNEILPIINIGIKLPSVQSISYKKQNRLVKTPFQSVSVAIFTEGIVDLLQYGFEEMLPLRDDLTMAIPPGWILEFIQFQEREVCVLNIPAILKELHHETGH